MELENLQQLYLDELRDLYSAENQLVKALPKMARAATARSLKNGFLKHLKQTEGHVKRLEMIFKELGESPRGKTCKAMQGLVAEGDEMIKQDAEPEVKDAGLIAAAQRVEHYEIAGYGCVRNYARLLGNRKAATLLGETLKEEGQTDKDLTKLARGINVKAEHPAGPRKNARKKKQPGLMKRVLEMVS